MGVKTDFGGIVILELFPHCNINCDFCYQNSDRRTNYFDENKKLHEKSKLYYMNMFLEKYKTYNITGIDYCDFWGGELFYDQSDEYNDKLMEIIRTVNPQKKFGATTNLSVINKTLNSLLFDKQPFTLELGASYDAVGRFHNQKMLDTYLANLEIVKTSPNLSKGKLMVETVLTAEMLDDKYDFKTFDKLYADPQIDNCLLIDFRGYPDYILDNFGERLFRILKRYPLLDNTRNFLAFSGVIGDEEVTPCENEMDRYCYCLKPNSHYFSYVTKFDQTDNHCSSCNKDDYKKIPIVWGCDNCPYNKICADICPGSVVNSGLIKMVGKCPFKYIFDRVDDLKKSYMITKELMDNRR